MQPPAFGHFLTAWGQYGTAFARRKVTPGSPYRGVAEPAGRRRSSNEAMETFSDEFQHCKRRGVLRAQYTAPTSGIDGSRPRLRVDFADDLAYPRPQRGRLCGGPFLF